MIMMIYYGTFPTSFLGEEIRPNLARGSDYSDFSEKIVCMLEVVVVIVIITSLKTGYKADPIKL